MNSVNEPEIKKSNIDEKKEDKGLFRDMNLHYSTFLGCVIPNRYPMIERSVYNVFKKLGIELQEMKGASCCPAPGVFRSVDNATWVTLAARNITIAEENQSDLLTLCNGCYGTLLEVNHQMRHEPELRERVNGLLNKIGRNYKGTTRVRQVVDVLYNDIGLDNLKSLVKNKLDLRIAVHYGCHLLKPAKIRPFNDEFEDPHFFDEIVEALGNKSLNYRSKMLCCGAGGAVRTSIKGTSLQFTLEKMREIRRSGADCIVVCCPFCYLQFDLGQIEARDMLNEDEYPFEIPVIFITQLMGLAMGMSFEELGLVKPDHLSGISPFVDNTALLEKISKKIKKNKEEKH